MEPTEIDNLLYKRITKPIDDKDDKYRDYYLEQYRMYLHIFNSTSDRRNKANEFFLGLNGAIIAVLGYVEIKDIPHASLVFVLVPIAGIAICQCWYSMICAYKQLNSAKFKVIHNVEKNLPLSLFETEWHILGKGKVKSKYYPLSQIEKKIPIIFILFYILILILDVNFNSILEFFI